jgi:hypothetical protein
MDIKRETNNLTSKERIIVAVLTGWTLLHFILLQISDGSKTYFWPFDKDPSLKSDYDFSEFTAYGLIPWVVFLVYKLLNKTTNQS